MLEDVKVCPSHVHVLRVRNKKQIYNSITYENTNNRFSRDEIYNTMIIAHNSIISYMI